MNYYNPYQQPVQYPNPMEQLAQMRQQAMQPQYPQQQFNQPQQPSMIWVKDFSEAEKMQVPPGVPLWDQNRPYVYQKEVDGSGRARTKRIRLVEEPDELQQPSEFVTWDKFTALAENVSALANYIKGLNKEGNVNE